MSFNRPAINPLDYTHDYTKNKGAYRLAAVYGSDSEEPKNTSRRLYYLDADDNEVELQSVDTSGPENIYYVEIENGVAINSANGQSFPIEPFIKLDNGDDEISYALYQLDPVKKIIGSQLPGSFVSPAKYTSKINVSIDDVTGLDDELKSKVTYFDTIIQATNESDTLRIYEGSALNIREYSTGNGGGAMWDVVLTSSVSPNNKNIVQSNVIPSLSLKLRLSDGKVNGKQFGAVGDGVTFDTQALLIASEVNKLVYLPKSQAEYLADSPYSFDPDVSFYGEGVLKFSNADFVRRGGSSGGIDVNEKYTLFYNYASESDVSILFNGVSQAITFIDDYTVQAPGSLLTDVVTIRITNGTLSLSKVPTSLTSFNTMLNGGYKLNPTAPQDVTLAVGDNNVSLGARSSQNITNGKNNVALGSRTLVSLENGINNTAVGFQTLYRAKAFDNTAIGSISGEWIESGHSNTLVGKASGAKIVGGRWNVALGVEAMGEAEESKYSVAIGYRSNGNTGANSQSNSVYIGAFSGDFCKGSNTVAIGYRALNCEKNLTSTPENYTVVGSFAGRNVDDGQDCVIVGTGAASDYDEMNYCTVVGMESGSLVEGGTTNHLTTLGYKAASNSTGDGNTAIGSGALITETTGENNTAIGFNSGRLSQGGVATNFSESVAIGSDARVSGSNQVQLGNSTTTVYAYGAVQDRSDARDKIIQGGITDNLIAFFMDVEWKTYKLNYRENYIKINDDGVIEKLDNDLSKAGSREHVGAIAQQVEEAMNKHGVDFAGLQHHSIKGGEDVYTIGYQEFIGIQGEIIQRQQKDIKSILDRLDSAGI